MPHEVRYTPNWESETGLLLALDEKSQETLGHVDPAQTLGGVAGLHQGLCPDVTILLDYFGMMRGWTMAR